jgi:hypothetical protein
MGVGLIVILFVVVSVMVAILTSIESSVLTWSSSVLTYTFQHANPFLWPRSQHPKTTSRGIIELPKLVESADCFGIQIGI